MTNEEQIAVLLAVKVLVETVKEAPGGWAPKGPCYLAFNMQGVTLDQFNNLVGACVNLGFLKSTSEILTYVGTPELEHRFFGKEL